MENAEPPREHRQIPWLTIGLVLLPVLYLASVGPLYGLNERGVLPDAVWDSLCGSVFLPLAWLETETDLFKTFPGEAYLRYIQLFEP